MKLKGFKGIVGCPVTPFSKDNSIDKEGVQRQIDFLMMNGVHALGMNMHLAECLNLSMDERKELVNIAVDSAKSKIPVIINIAYSGTDLTIELSKYAEDAGADGVCVILPYHWHPSPRMIETHFRAVAEALDIAVFAYNYPERIGVNLAPTLAAKMADQLDNFIGIKEASDDIAQFLELCRLTEGKDFSVLVGADGILPAMAAGAHGAMSAVAVLAPRLVMELYSLCASGDFQQARPLQFKVERIWVALKQNFPSSMKAALEILGRPVGLPRKPLLPLEGAERIGLEKVLRETGVLEGES